ncbi:MAG: hypothetical protein VX453_14395 [Acidobacteriota bacterium]|nr:hypothetical protein [Acidobacteriota bacterium]
MNKSMDSFPTGCSENGRWLRDPGVIVAVVFLVAGSFVALSVDVPRALRGIKGDEATYVAMALSLAHDGDLVYERQDEERFFSLYQGGPEGIYLKGGVRSIFEVNETFPFLHRLTYSDGRDDRFYFGKAYISSVFAVPFVWLAGINGLLWFNVVLFSLVFLCGYRFIAATSREVVAVLYALAFFGVSVVPLYVLWLSSDMFHIAGVVVSYFLWFYKDVAPNSVTWWDRWFRGGASDLLAAVLLGLVIFSKPWPHPLLILPPVLHLWRQRRFRHGVVVGFLAAAVSWAAFGLNGAVSGELNYQGGLDRRYVAGEFPFEQGNEWSNLGVSMATNSIVVEEPLGTAAFLTLAFHNARYFLFGRHFGFVPFFFPGVVAVVLFLSVYRTARMWGWVTLGTIVLAAATLAIYMPFTWSGGGGPSGNRYFLSIYPLLLFLTPPLRTHWTALAACLGGALFIGHILVDPFASAKQTYVGPERGLLRALPVELTTVLDLPIMLDAPRARVSYGDSPMMQLYFLDRNASLPEPQGFWILGKRRADIIVRTGRELVTITVTARSPIATKVSIDIGGGDEVIALKPGVSGTATIRPAGVYSRQSWAYLMRIRTSDGFVPRLVESGSTDSRFLGAAINLTVLPVADR